MLFSATINLRMIIFIMKAEIFVRYEVRWLCSFLAIVSLNREPLLLFKVLNLIEHGKSAFPMQLLLAWLFISQ